MENPIPVNDPPKAGLAPSASTTGSLMGACAATVIVYVVEQTLHWQVPGFVEVAFSTLLTALAGYLPDAGRR